jgi:plasmid stabilization system protein ParE
MAAEYLFHPYAESELREAVRYYSERSYKAPQDLINDFDLHIDRIIANPVRYHPCYGPYRRCNMERFPFGIIYRRKADSIYLIAFFHEKRHPDYWKHRIADDQE